jgi:hypothetical protein
MGGKRNQQSSSVENKRKTKVFAVKDIPKRGGNYKYFPILSRSSLSFLSYHAKRIAQDDGRRLKRRQYNGYACPSHIPYRQLGRIDLKLGERDIVKKKKQGSSETNKKQTSSSDNTITAQILKSQRLFLGQENNNNTRQNGKETKSKNSNNDNGNRNIYTDIFPTQLGKFNSGIWRRNRVVYTRKRNVDKKLRSDIHSAHRRVKESKANAVEGTLSNHIANCQVKTAKPRTKLTVDRNDEFDSDDDQYYEDEGELEEEQNVKPRSKKVNSIRGASKPMVKRQGSNLTHAINVPFHADHVKDMRSDHFEDEDDDKDDVDILRKGRRNDSDNKENKGKFDDLNYLPYQSRRLSPRPIKILDLEAYQSASKNSIYQQGRANSAVHKSNGGNRGRRRRSISRIYFDLPPESTMVPLPPDKRKTIHRKFERKFEQLDRSHLNLVKPRQDGDDDDDTVERAPTPGLPNIKSFRPVNRLRSAADEFSNIRNELDEKLSVTLHVLKHDRPEAFQRKFMQLSSGLHAISWRKEIECIRLGAEVARLSENVEMHKKVTWFYNFLRDYIEHKELLQQRTDATSFNNGKTTESKFTPVETFIINFIHRVLEHKHVFDDQKLQLLKDHLKSHEEKEAIALFRILHQHCKTISKEHYHHSKMM